MKKIKTLNLNFLFLFLLLTMAISRQQDHHQQSTVESKGSKYSIFAWHVARVRNWKGISNLMQGLVTLKD